MHDSNMKRVAQFVSGAAQRQFPADVLDEAKKCLVDWVAVCVAARGAAEAQAVLRVAQAWASQGNARVVGSKASMAAPLAAMVNGTLSHCLDYDDTHIPTAIHVSGPTWAAVLAAGAELGSSEELLLKAFVVGFEVAARLGAGGIGVRLNDSGWHATAVLGRLGTTAAVAVLHQLDEETVAYALGLAATQAGGLTASFGTMAKPFHPGKAAMDAILSVQLAAAGLEGSDGVLEPGGRFLPVLLQQPGLEFDIEPFGDAWEIRRNSFKPYAACQLTHAAIDAARALRSRVNGRGIASLQATVHPLAIKIAGIADPVTPTQGKFSLGFCIALALEGYGITTEDFTPSLLGDPVLQDITRRVALVSDAGVERTATRLEITMSDGEHLVEMIEHAFGSVGNPMGWQDLDSKFMALMEPAIGSDAALLLEVLHGFEQADALRRFLALCVARD